MLLVMPHEVKWGKPIIANAGFPCGLWLGSAVGEIDS